MNDSTPRPSLAAIAACYLKITLSSFGGGLSSWTQLEVVEKRRWLTDDEFLSALAMCRILPGPNMVNFAVYLGSRLRGLPGVAAALVGLLLVPFMLIVSFGTAYSQFQHLAYVQRAITGVAAAAAGMTIGMGLKLLGRRSLTLPFLLILATAFIAIGILRYPLLIVLAVLIPVSAAVLRVYGKGGRAG